jgi:hypothetical protein
VSEITESPVPDCQSNTPTLSKEEVQTLGHLTNKLVSPSQSNFAHASMPMIAFNSSTIFDFDPWVIDSGANDHMTWSSNFFSFYNPFSCKDKVLIADGS